ncbi:platelet-activating factor receptor-like [Amia ocellicauda]|uniref:platelet-activating factor receptor-like n=1 Tax=Amia ocellicauda TaxID=2972642 RepID=UPI003464CF9D
MTCNTSNGINLTSLVDSQFRYILFPVVYSLVFVVGLIANCYVLWVFKQMFKSEGVNEIKIYMINLVVADLLFVAALPLWIVYYIKEGNWLFSGFLCSISGSLFFINGYCSVLFLGVISFNRCRAVTKPLETVRSTQIKRGIVVSATIWVLILASAFSSLFDDHLNSDGELCRCFEGYHYQDESAKKKVAVLNFAIIGMFFCVFLLVVVCNLLIIRTLLSQTVKQQGNRKRGVKQRALWMVCAVLVVFVVCFIPHHIVQGPWTLAVLWGNDKALNDAHQITLCLMGLNCILDPIVYCFATRKFQIHFLSRLKIFNGSRKCSRYTSETGVSIEYKPNGQLMEQLKPPQE